MSGEGAETVRKHGRNQNMRNRVVNIHWEHVIYNVTKWKKMGFDRCHIWSKSPQIHQIHASLVDEEKRDVRLMSI